MSLLRLGPISGSTWGFVSERRGTEENDFSKAGMFFVESVGAGKSKYIAPGYLN
jgi:hypothetical protein